MLIKKHFELLGMKCKDKVTGITGVITSLSFDLYGCVQAAINPGLDKDDKPVDSRWYDVSRIEITSDGPVMDVPNFDYGPVAEGKKGPAEKPSMMKP